MTAISSSPEDGIKQLEQCLSDNVGVIPGDSNNSSVLRKAGTDRCRAILAPSDSDADSVFVILSVKDMSSDVKTVPAVNDSKNLDKIKMAHPNIIPSPQLFGSKILAQVLNGEEINNDILISMLLGSGHDIFSNNDKRETKADSKESTRKQSLETEEQTYWTPRWCPVHLDIVDRKQWRVTLFTQDAPPDVMDTYISTRLPLRPTRFASASPTLYMPTPHFHFTPLHVNCSMQQQDGYCTPTPDADQCSSRIFIRQMSPYA